MSDATLSERSKGRNFVKQNFSTHEHGLKSENLNLEFFTHKQLENSIVLRLTRDGSREANDQLVPLSITGKHFFQGTTFLEVCETGELLIKSHQDLMQTVGKEISIGNIEQARALFLEELSADFQMGLCFSIFSGEVFLGGAEDHQGQIKNRMTFESYNVDALGVGGRGRYQNTPVFWSSRGYLFAIISPEPLTIDFGNSRSSVLEIATLHKALEILVAPFKDATRAFAQFREVFSPVKNVPTWSYGLWFSRCYYKDQRELESVLHTAKENDIDIGVINLDARAWMKPDNRTDFVWDCSRWDHFQTYIPSLTGRGYRVCLWENPYVSSQSELYQEGRSKKYFATARNGGVYPLTWVPSGLEDFPTAPIAGLVDFTNESARSWWKDLHRPYIRAGVSAFKTDFGEEVPHDACFSNGMTGREIRNLYSDLYNGCVSEVLEEELHGEGVLWARSAYLKAASHPIKWNGDSPVSFRGLQASIKAGLTQSCGGALFWSHDIGGFYGEKPDPYLFMIWAQVGLWGSHVRFHGTTEREPWCFGDRALVVIRRAIKLRECLMDYFISEGEACVAQKKSFMRPIWLEETNEEYAVVEDQFFAGSRFLVAPYLDRVGGRKVRLPKGSWVDIRTLQAYKGDQTIQADREDFIPVYLRLVEGDDKIFDVIREFSAAQV